MDATAIEDDFLVMIPNHLCSATEFQALPVKVQRAPKAKHMTIVVADRFIKPVSKGGQKVHIIPAKLFTRMVADIQVMIIQGTGNQDMNIQSMDTRAMDIQETDINPVRDNQSLTI